MEDFDGIATYDSSIIVSLANKQHENTQSTSVRKVPNSDISGASYVNEAWRISIQARSETAYNGMWKYVTVTVSNTIPHLDVHLIPPRTGPRSRTDNEP